MLVLAESAAMDGFGGRLRARAEELGFTDAEVARRLGLGQGRYQHYVAGRRRPDFGTLIRICEVLGTTPSILLGFDQAPKLEGERAKLIERIGVTTTAMSDAQLRTAARILDALLLEGSERDSRS